MINISEYLQQKESLLIAKKECSVIIDLNFYDIGENLIIDEEKDIIWVKSLIAKFQSGKAVVFDLILDYAVELKITEKIKHGEEEIVLNFHSGETILEISLETQDIGKQINYVQRLLRGGEIIKDANHLILKIKDVYGPHSDMDLVHLEILLSNVLRDKNNPKIPARLGKIWDPKMMNIKDIVFEGGFIQSLNFENLSKSLMRGLISETAPRQSIVERILSGELYRKEEE